MTVGVFSLWRKGGTLHKLALVGDLTPVLASWDGSHSPAQQKVGAYLAWLEAEMRPQLDGEQRLLHMDIAVRDPNSLTHHHDLENYLTPVVQCLGSGRFCLVSATKSVGGDSSLSIGVAEPLRDTEGLAGFGYCAVAAGQGPHIKARIHAALTERVAADPSLRLPAPPAQAEVHLA